MALEVGKAYVGVMPDLKGFGAKLAAGINAEGKLGALAGGKGAALAFGAAFGVAVAGTGYLAKLGGEFQQAYQTIRVTTGATGAELDKLKGSFKNVMSESAASMGDASTAVSTFSQRLGLSGKPLEELSLQMIRLSSKTGTDLTGNLNAAADALYNWGVPATKMGDTNDMLFRVTQKTGISFQELTSSLATGGAQFRAAGFDIQGAASVIGLLSKAGLGASDAMPALQFAMKKAAKEGKDAKTVFQDTFNAIKAAPNDVEAAGIAVDTFGGRAGPKFAALVREGKLSWEDFSKSIGKGDTIKAAADDTKTWEGSLKNFKNILKVDLEPAATSVFNNLGKALKASKPAVELFGKALGVVATVLAGIPGPVWAVMGALAVGLVTFNKVTKVIGAIQTAWQGLNAVFAFAAANPIVLIMLAIAAVIALVVWKWDWLKENVPKAWDRIKEATASAWNWIKDFFSKFWPYLLGAIFGPIGLIVAYLATHWDQVKASTALAWGWVRDHIAAVWDTIKTWVGEKVAAVRDAVANTFDNIRDRVTGAMSALWNFLMAPFRWISDQAHKVGDAVHRIAERFESVRDRVAGAVAGLIGWITGFVDSAKAKLKELKDWIASNLSNLLGPLAGPLASIARLFGVGGSGSGRGGGRASGGPVDTGKEYLVGENGPELVRFGQPGTVTTAHATRRLLEAVATKAGGGGITVAGPMVAINGDVVIRSDQDITDLSRQLAKDINRQARAQGTNIPLTGSVA